MFPQQGETTKISAELFKHLRFGLLASCSDSLRLSKDPCCNKEEACLLSRILVPEVLVPLFDDFRQINFLCCILSSFLVVLVDAASFLSQKQSNGPLILKVRCSYSSWKVAMVFSSLQRGFTTGLFLATGSDSRVPRALLHHPSSIFFVHCPVKKPYYLP